MRWTTISNMFFCNYNVFLWLFLISLCESCEICDMIWYGVVISVCSSNPAVNCKVVSSKSCWAEPTFFCYPQIFMVAKSLNKAAISHFEIMFVVQKYDARLKSMKYVNRRFNSVLYDVGFKHFAFKTNWTSAMAELSNFSIPHPSTDGRFNSTAEYAMGTRSVSADLKMVPNQPLHCQVPSALLVIISTPGT